MVHGKIYGNIIENSISIPDNSDVLEVKTKITVEFPLNHKEKIQGIPN